ncbi:MULTISPECIES: FadR/GntR family transcriptional regulator [unclassified Duganella]|jgi:GntR family transcriptional repressor for pyruvate dehydrogenase complex|uniref:FadR/GntR family transcriptional regulator n=1 Tax=unclassified Duganella TaxID=2636909 RepID=UPI000889FC38|nr:MULTISPECIES: FadR/GntR family transcriptional regulator [unclassified Duganella]SDG68368.1 DNA-binding transcriptional regulator, FadR family [Duganella sp. OV458]SDJ93678.1 transcriptional regulator, GntR family [Duganella sp. OV510]
MNQTVSVSVAAAAPAPVPKKKHRNLAQGVVESFTSSIQAGTLKPGEKLPTESVIMEMHGVSRTVVREAISHLQAAGLVQTRHGIGTFVLEPQPANIFAADTIRTIGDVLSILELRISLETEAAWLAATRRSDEQVTAMEAALQRIVAAPNRAVAVESDKAFHLLIAQATGNRYFVDILSDLGNTIIPRARLDSEHLVHDEPKAYQERVNREHDDIYHAILRKDAEAARAAMRTHLSNSRERLRRAQQEVST